MRRGEEVMSRGEEEGEGGGRRREWMKEEREGDNEMEKPYVTMKECIKVIK